MNPEDKGWIAEEKKHYENYKLWAPGAYETIHKSFQIIESQEKEIERLKLEKRTFKINEDGINGTYKKDWNGDFVLIKESK